jgi:hypothetical protein
MFRLEREGVLSIKETTYLYIFLDLQSRCINLKAESQLLPVLYRVPVHYYISVFDIGSV